jgi:hypothetical protein
MSKQVVAEVIALIELGMIAPEDIVKCLRKANSEPEQALAAPVQPETDSCGSGAGCLYKVAMIENLESEVERLKAAQRQWVGLTDEDIDAIYLQHHTRYGEGLSVDFGYERAIEAKLKEKNT